MAFPLQPELAPEPYYFLAGGDNPQYSHAQMLTSTVAFDHSAFQPPDFYTPSVVPHAYASIPAPQSTTSLYVYESTLDCIAAAAAAAGSSQQPHERTTIPPHHHTYDDQEPPPPPPLPPPAHISKTSSSTTATSTTATISPPVSPPDDATTTKSLRRRAQNRAAQRAFRERRERYVAELEDRVRAMEARRDGLQQENERLRSIIVSLQGTIGAVLGGGGGGGGGGSGGGGGGGGGRRVLGGVLGGTACGGHKAADDSCEGGGGHGGRGCRARVVADADSDAAAATAPPVLPPALPRRPTRDGESLVDGAYGEADGKDGDGDGDRDGRNRLLSFAATWNLVQAHPGVRDGRLDLADMWERLKADGVPQPTGYMFRRSVVEAVLAFDDDDDDVVKRQFVIL